jgi:hypothetical protein
MKPTRAAIFITNGIEDQPNRPASNPQTTSMRSRVGVWMPMMTLSQLLTFSAWCRRSSIRSGSFCAPHTTTPSTKKVYKEESIHASHQSGLPAMRESIPPRIKVTTTKKRTVFPQVKVVVLELSVEDCVLSGISDFLVSGRYSRPLIINLI